MCFAAIAGFAQEDREIEAVYPPLARQARIQGDVRLNSGPEGLTVISGHPLLVPPSLDSLKKLGKVWTTETDVVYHFILVETSSRLVRETVRRGDAVDRLFLRILGMKTTKVIERYECIQSPAPPTRIDMSRRPVEVWVYGPLFCLQTAESQIATR